jgi:protein-S-isoprenylcysteine O-methyltransferase Ste14
LILLCRNHFLFLDLENLFIFLIFSFFLAIIIDYNKEEGNHQSEAGTQYQGYRWKEPVRGRKAPKNPGKF